MPHNALQFVAGLVLVVPANLGWNQASKPCADHPPPSIYVVKSEYPFQEGAELSYDELYHGPWKTTVDLPVYTKPRSSHLAGTIKQGNVVTALLGETIVVHPFRFVAKADYEVETGGFEPGKAQR